MAHVQSKSSIVTSGSTITLTFDSNIAAGNVIALAPWVFETSTTIVSVVDNLGNTYTFAGDNAQTLGNGQAWNYYAPVTTGGACTITVTLSTTTAISYLMASEISSTTVLDVHDGNGQNTPGTGIDEVTSTAQTTTVNGAYVWGAMLHVGPDSIAAGTNFISDLSLPELMIEHYIQPSAGSIAATFTLSGGGSNYTATVMLTFKASSGPTAAQLIPAFTQTGGGYGVQYV